MTLAKVQGETIQNKPAVITDEVLRQLVDKMVSDAFSLGHVSLKIVNNGKLAKEVEQQESNSREECRGKILSVDLNEHRKTFDNFSSGKTIDNIATPAVDSAISECFDARNKSLKLVDQNILMPEKDLKKLLSDPKVFEELKKSDPSNFFIRLAEKYQPKPEVVKTNPLPVVKLNLPPPPEDPALLAKGAVPVKPPKAEAKVEVHSVPTPPVDSPEPITKKIADTKPEKEVVDRKILYAIMAVILLIIFLIKKK